MCSQSSFGWVSPFRNRRIKGYLLLPGAYRSLSRLSSALSAKASTICSFMLDQIDLCRFITQTSAPSVVLIWFRFYILNCFVVYRNHLVLILGYWLLTISIPRMSWYFIWYSMCSFQGTVYQANIGFLSGCGDACIVCRPRKIWLSFEELKWATSFAWSFACFDWLSSHQVRKAFIRILIGAFSYLIAVQHAFTLRVNRSCKTHNCRHQIVLRTIFSVILSYFI